MLPHGRIAPALVSNVNRLRSNKKHYRPGSFGIVTPCHSLLEAGGIVETSTLYSDALDNMAVDGSNFNDYKSVLRVCSTVNSPDSMRSTRRTSSYVISVCCFSSENHLRTFNARAVLKASGGTFSRPPLRMSMSNISRLQSSRTCTTGIACFCRAGFESCFTAS